MDYIWIFILSAVLLGWFYSKVKPKPELICTRCYAVGQTKTKAEGSILIELVLWLCFIIPGLLYSLWRDSARKKVCSQCGCKDLVPVESPRGKMLIKENGIQTE